jgi:hypothetical protein
LQHVTYAWGHNSFADARWQHFHNIPDPTEVEHNFDGSQHCGNVGAPLSSKFYITKEILIIAKTVLVHNAVFRFNSSALVSAGQREIDVLIANIQANSYQQ